MPSGSRPATGHTVPELLVVLAIAALLFSAAAPSLMTLAARSRVDTAVETMVGAVRFTRHLAVSRGRLAVLCPGQGPACGSRNSWDTGANIAVNGDVALTLPRLPEGYRVTWNRSAAGITFRPDGSITQAGSLLVCAPDGDPRHARRIVVNNQGRLYQERDRDGDGRFDGIDRRTVDC
ncbi:MAG: GspH/FimT family pseudopilin [Gammaproteobacteria bacterium]|nr:GspH/FimT family pseudopilin [Gammaproteobacteria bacterium]